MYSYGQTSFLNIKQNFFKLISKNSYIFANLLIKSLLKCFLWHLIHFNYLNINNLSTVDMYSRQDLQFVHLPIRSPSARLSTRLDNELDINLKLPINPILFVIFLLFQVLHLLVLKKLCHIYIS